MIGQMMMSFVLSMILIAVRVTGSKLYDTQDDEVDRLLKKLNKPALKSIKSPDGDIIDCIHMKNHPIYDHPLFKNHTIQMKPSFYPEGWHNESLNIEKQSMVTQLWRINGKCPKNSIAIRRTRREDILRAKSIKRYEEKYHNMIPKPKLANSTSTNSQHSHAVLKVKGNFHGAKAIINVWRPYVQTPKEFSLAQIWVIAGPSSSWETIEVGWQVYPYKYGDDNPRFFIYWTADGYKKRKCYNLDCKGFVQVNGEFAIGAAIKKVSTYDGEQYYMPTYIWKEPTSGNWWLMINDNQIIGYWPSSLFKELQTSATEVHWGGEIIDYKDGLQHTSTHMGSGHFAWEGFKRASYFKNLEVFDGSEKRTRPLGVYAVMTEESCYDIKPQFDVLWGVYFFYGGPGRSLDCL